MTCDVPAGSNHARITQSVTTGSGGAVTTYLNDPAANVMAERYAPPTGGAQWKTYIVAGGRIVALRTTTGASGNPAMRYFVLDHLGSVSVVPDETGAVVTGGRQSYDAWGKQRNLDGTPDTT